ncbi:FxSxx-COOH system tetratricopeptide repeat protein [Streptomyces sp. NPDC060085]|uniref:FxSxx-COOH system tetratricopeptide repeat protein n=1 Tax=Streptomyces sp. NPDC060085 TaxID=3347054 RepID=UPI00365F58AF
MAGDTYNGPTGDQHGNDNTQYNYFHHTSSARAAWPHQVGVIPPRAECFQDRAEAARLRQALAGGGTAVVGQPQAAPADGVLAGMGGVGKTQLAADYARTAWAASEVDVLVWITASDSTTVASAYGQAGIEVLGADAAAPEAAARQFLAWLEPKSESKPCRWLVVLDDIADPSALNGWWPPSSPYGRTLATTRRRDAALIGAGRRRIEVGEFTSAEAAAYLSDALAVHGRTEPPDDIAALAHDLGCLPLALSQAAAYMIDSGTPCAAYRTLLADRTRARTLADLSPDVLPDGQRHTMAAAWSLSIDYADQLRPAGLARPMLQLAAFLDPNNIPISVLGSQPALDYLTACRTADPASPEGSAEQVVSVDEAGGALRALHRLSLLQAPATDISAEKVSGSGGSVQSHQIIQRATRDALTPEQREQTAHAAADALLAVWPTVERDTALSAVLRANTTALLSTAPDELMQPDAHTVLFVAGRSLGNSGQIAAAHDFFTQLLHLTTQHLGPDHPDTLATRANLAHWRGEAGDITGAATAFEELLHDQLPIQGPDHPDTLATRANLAHWRGEAGDVTGAATAFEELLHDQLRIQGCDHPDTLMARHNLADWRGEAGDATGAATAFEELLHDQLRILGPDHPSTLTTRNNLAHWRGEGGDATGAATAYEELLSDRLRILGPDHPSTLITRHNLADWRGEAGDATGAATAFEEVLSDRLRILGPDHPSTLITRHNLADWRGEAGDATGAATAFEELLHDQLRILGRDHPDTLATRRNLARWRGSAETG